MQFLLYSFFGPNRSRKTGPNSIRTSGGVPAANWSSESVGSGQVSFHPFAPGSDPWPTGQWLRARNFTTFLETRTLKFNQRLVFALPSPWFSVHFKPKHRK